MDLNFFSKDLLNKKMDLNFFSMDFESSIYWVDFFVNFLYAFPFESRFLTKKSNSIFLILIFRLWKEIFHRFGCVPKRGLSKVQGIKGDMTETLPRKEQARLEPEQRICQTHPLNFIYITMNKMPKYT